MKIKNSNLFYGNVRYHFLFISHYQLLQLSNFVTSSIVEKRVQRHVNISLYRKNSIFCRCLILGQSIRRLRMGSIGKAFKIGRIISRPFLNRNNQTFYRKKKKSFPQQIFFIFQSLSRLAHFIVNCYYNAACILL